MWRQMVQDFIIQFSEMNVFFQHVGISVIAFIPFIESPGGAVVGALVCLPIFSAAFISMISNWLSVMLIILPFNALLTKFRDRRSKKDGFIQNRVNKARERYEKYGVPGVAIIAPLVASGHIAALCFTRCRRK